MTTAVTTQPSTLSGWDVLVDQGWDFTQGVLCGVISHYMMESCEQMHRNDPSSTVPYTMPMIYFLGAAALETCTQSKIGKTGAAFFGSFVASKLPFFGFAGKDVQYIVAALTGGGVKRLIDKGKWFA